MVQGKRLLRQVHKKSQALAGFLSGQPEVQQRYAALQLANKLISQCEVQARHPPDIWNLAECKACKVQG